MMEASRAPADATGGESAACLPLLMPLIAPPTAGMDLLLEAMRVDAPAVGQLQRCCMRYHSLSPTPFTVLIYACAMCALPQEPSWRVLAHAARHRPGRTANGARTCPAGSDSCESEARSATLKGSVYVKRVTMSDTNSRKEGYKLSLRAHR